MFFSFSNVDVKPLVCERKFVSDRVRPEVAISVLNSYCRPDGQFPEGELESIYFDDANLTSYWEKINGDSLKRKVRIRWYHYTADKEGHCRAFLEIKNRIGAARDKERYEFIGNYDFLSNADISDLRFVKLLEQITKDSGLPIPSGIVPSVAIRYHRNRFVCPLTHSRISVDYNLQCTRANKIFFPMPVKLTTPLVVCEAKSPTARHWNFEESISRIGFHLESFSKYGHFVTQQLQGGFA